MNAKKQTEKVKLLKPATYRGQVMDAGAEIEVTPDTRAWMAKRGLVANRTTTTTDTKGATE